MEFTTFDLWFAKEKIEMQLAAIKKMPHLVRAFFRTPSVTYMNDSLVNPRFYAERTRRAPSASRLLKEGPRFKTAYAVLRCRLCGQVPSQKLSPGLPRLSDVAESRVVI